MSIFIIISFPPYPRCNRVQLIAEQLLFTWNEKVVCVEARQDALNDSVFSFRWSFLSRQSSRWTSSGKICDVVLFVVFIIVVLLNFVHNEEIRPWLAQWFLFCIVRHILRVVSPYNKVNVARAKFTRSVPRYLPLVATHRFSIYNTYNQTSQKTDRPSFRLKCLTVLHNIFYQSLAR